jgi:hypothetical protein
MRLDTAFAMRCGDVMVLSALVQVKRGVVFQDVAVCLEDGADLRYFGSRPTDTTKWLDRLAVAH